MQQAPHDIPKTDYVLFQLRLCVSDLQLLKDELSPVDIDLVARNLTRLRDAILEKQYQLYYAPNDEA